MTFPDPLNTEPNDFAEPLMVPPNDNTDGTDPKCECGHKPTDHHPFKGPDNTGPAWQCVYCSCTRAFPAAVPTTH